MLCCNRKIITRVNFDSRATVRAAAGTRSVSTAHFAHCVLVMTFATLPEELLLAVLVSLPARALCAFEQTSRAHSSVGSVETGPRSVCEHAAWLALGSDGQGGPWKLLLALREAWQVWNEFAEPTGPIKPLMPLVWDALAVVAKRGRHLFTGRPLDLIVMCTIYSMCKLHLRDMSPPMAPRSTFNRIIQQYMRQTSPGTCTMRFGNPRIRNHEPAIKQHLLIFWHHKWSPAMTPYFMP